ncbi:Eukaryotic translation initiation factor 3 subunit E [Frankliniella fusca]|uniref:Eukaryotic translation initiation factor 3 subunit E n=1 Tax=Frankliniella fusca TaxID=407009 RepID=A0AAE1H8U8_9NEOP|nr:Eukaryotic translation initiation factor 3 subunit E [Frankliniella fusca]
MPVDTKIEIYMYRTLSLFAMFVVQASAGRRLTSKDITNFSLMKNRNILAGIVKGILTVLIT